MYGTDGEIKSGGDWRFGAAVLCPVWGFAPFIVTEEESYLQKTGIAIWKDL